MQFEIGWMDGIDITFYLRSKSFKTLRAFFIDNTPIELNSFVAMLSRLNLKLTSFDVVATVFSNINFFSISHSCKITWLMENLITIF